VHGEQQDIYCSRKKEEEEEEVGILGIALIILFFCLLLLFLLLLLRDIMFSPFPSGRDFSPKLGAPLLRGRIIALL
jgi:hypothetical protein